MSCEYCLGYVHTEESEEELQESDLFLDCGEISEDCPCYSCEFGECAMICEEKDCEFLQEFNQEGGEIVESDIVLEIFENVLKCSNCNTYWKKENGTWEECIIN